MGETPEAAEVDQAAINAFAPRMQAIASAAKHQFPGGPGGVTGSPVFIRHIPIRRIDVDTSHDESGTLLLVSVLNTKTDKGLMLTLSSPEQYDMACTHRFEELSEGDIVEFEAMFSAVEVHLSITE